MKKSSFKTPIAYFIFNRPWITAKSFEVIKKLRPRNLYIIADGPRENFPHDYERCQETRNIVKNIDWECNLKKNYSDKNQGMKNRNISGLNWLFEQEEMSIILEDDNLADLSFFNFASELLEYYKNDENIFQITGVNWQNGIKRNENSYYFSKYNHLWGWATWRRCWKHYDKDIKFWKEWKKSKEWKNTCPDFTERIFWTKMFDEYLSKDLNSWAYPWLLTAFYRKGLTIIPKENLVRNIGFFGGGTHEFAEDNLITNNFSIDKILDHPKKVINNEAADMYTFDNIFDGKNMRSLTNKIKFFFYDKFS